MSNVIHNQYLPDYVSPPGETIEEILEERGMTQAELAERMGRPKKTINEIIKGKAAITPETALQLELVLDVSARFWNNREKFYQESLAIKNEYKRLKGQVAWLKEIPYKAMIKLGWIQKFADKVEQLKEVLNFFAIVSPEQYQQGKSLAVNFRKSQVFDSDNNALNAWLRKGEIEASKINCADYDQNKFKEILQEIRLLTIESPSIFSLKMQELCAKVGVALVLVPQLPQTRASGAAYWLNPNKALIQLSLRYKVNDHFWFSFFHEAGHILLHGKRDIFIELEDRTELDKQEKEQEANQFAANILIPPDDWETFINTRRISKEAIVEFATQLNIAPGIIVGRLQHENILPKNHCNGLKQQLNWEMFTTSPIG